MNKREIIERLKNITRHARHTVGEEPFVMSLDDGIAVYEAIELLKKPEQRWIPCSERQPDKEGDYLVTLCDDGRTWVEIALWNETFGGRWQAVLYNDVDYSDISNVIAWMPLPEPYQRKGEQNGAEK